MVYNVLYNALCRLQILRNEEADVPILFRDTQIGEIGRKSFMRLIKVNQRSFILDMWKRKFNIDIGNEHWLIPTLATKETKLRVLHWKILHNVYPTNIHLYRMKLKDTEMCEWCESVDHTDHAFFSCFKIKPIWSEVEGYFSAKTNKIVKIEKEDAIFGVMKQDTCLNSRQLSFLNHLILIGKLTISKFRYGDRQNIIDMLHRELGMRIT